MVVTNQDIQTPPSSKGLLIPGGSLLNAPEDTTVGAAAFSENVSKATLTRLEVSQLPKKIPDFSQPGATKDGLIAEWLKQWITSGLESGKLNEFCLMPRKADIAEYLGVSVGTVQNAIRFVEDEGYVESKQRIGTLIRDVNSDGLRMRKQTSKRDQAVVAIKHLIMTSGVQPGEPLPSAREIAKSIGSAPNTTRLALEYLSGIGILENLGSRGNKANWLLREMPTADEELTVTAIESETLIDQLERDLKTLIEASYNVHEKLPSHLDLASMFKVSIKTVHDAMKRLSDQGIVCSKRGRYGTFILRKPDSSKFFTPADRSIFVPVEETRFYNYEKVEEHLKQFILQNHKVGDKLPSMGQLSEDLDVSSNTIRKALQHLAEEQMVKFTRGRYGGTFVTRLPDVKPEDAAGESKTSKAAFTWVSINPETIKSYRATANKGDKVTQ
jgi:DNA-binding GntR family transcriptional regulator